MESKCTMIAKLRGPKILDMSIFDWIASIGVAVCVGFLFKIKTTLSWVLFIVGWTLFGVLAHLLFGVKTMLGFYLGLNEKPDRKIIC